MLNSPNPQDQLNPQYGLELMLVTVGGVLLVVVLIVMASTSVVLMALAILATAALAAVITELVLQMTSDLGEGRARVSPATCSERRRAQARQSKLAREMFSSLAYAAAPYDNTGALAQETQRRRGGASRPGAAERSASARRQ